MARRGKRINERRKQMRTLQAKATRRAWIVAALIDTLAVAAAMLLVWLIAGAARADFVLAFHDYGCRACEAQRPAERLAKKLGVDLRVVNASQWPAGKRFYRIRRWPTYVLVREADGQQYDTGQRLGYPATAQQISDLADGMHSVLKQDAK